MGFWLALAVSLVITVVGELLRPKQSVPNAQASGLDEFEIPTAEAGRPVTVLVGKVKVTGSNVTWTGDFSSQPLTQKVKTGLFSSKRQVYAYRYRMGLQHFLGFGRDDLKIERILFGDYPNMPNHTRAELADGSTRFVFNDLNFFGGDKEEGGLSGALHFYRGTQTQTGNAYMQAQLGEPFPAYRGCCHAIVEGMYLGTQKYLKPIAFEISSYPNQLGVPDGKHIIGEDANPLCFVFEVITERIWGMGKTAGDVDIPAFIAAAQRVHDEGLGVSMIYNGQAAAKDVIADIMRHIDGVLFCDPRTGLLTVRLARKDYVKADLPLYTNDDFIGAFRFSRPSWSETSNTLKITYTDRANDYQEGVYIVQNLANIQSRNGEQAPTDLALMGFTDVQAVMKAGSRALNSLSYPLAKATVVLNRRAFATLPADVIRISCPELGVEDVVFRVTKVTIEDIERNTVTLELVEDIFSITESAYSPPPSSDWVNPVGPPLPPARQQLVEQPYYMQGANGSVAMVLASRSNQIDAGFALAYGPTVVAANDAESGPFFGTSAALSAALGATATSLVFSGLIGDGEDFNVAPTASDQLSGDTLVLLKSATTEEFITYGGYNGTTGALSSLTRGVLDTVPQAHPVGTQVWFLATGFAVAPPTPVTAGFPAPLGVRVMPYNALGQLPRADAIPMTTTLNNRAARPYPPGRVRVNGAAPSALGGQVTGSFTLTWEPRNRLTQQQVIGQDVQGIQPEAGTAYTVRLRDAAGTVLKASTGTGVTAALQVNYTGLLTVELVAVRDGLESNVQRFTMDYAGAANTGEVDTPEYVLDGGAP